MYRYDYLSPRAIVLIHLASLSHAGSVYGKTAKGMADIIELPTVTVFKTLAKMRAEGLVSSSLVRIDGKFPSISGHHTPLVYELTEEGMNALKELQELVFLVKKWGE